MIVKQGLYILLALSLVLVMFTTAYVHSEEPALAIIPDRLVTLTFDDGPDPRFTPRILDLLRAADVPATFFMVGRNMLAHPEIVQQIARDGHAMANHTTTHPHLETLSEADVRAELNGYDHALQTLFGPLAPHTPWFRPPRGRQSAAIDAVVAEQHKQLVLWNVCVENSKTTTPEQMRDRVVKLIRERGGGILLAHDGELDRSLTVQALPLLLDALQREGYRFVTLDEYEQARSLKQKRHAR